MTTDKHFNWIIAIGLAIFCFFFGLVVGVDLNSTGWEPSVALMRSRNNMILAKVSARNRHVQGDLLLLECAVAAHRQIESERPVEENP